MYMQSELKDGKGKQGTEQYTGRKNETGDFLNFINM